MMDILGHAGRVSAGEDLSQEEMAAAVDAIMSGQCDRSADRHAADRPAGQGRNLCRSGRHARALRRHMTPIRSRRAGLLDTCGTGGDGSRTFNISTAAALVAAAAGCRSPSTAIGP